MDELLEELYRLAEENSRINRWKEEDRPEYLAAELLMKQGNRIRKLESAMETLKVLTTRSPEWTDVIHNALREDI